MAVWYEMEKSEKGIKNFLDSNWSFHDFRIERIEYISEKDYVEVFLKYDRMKVYFYALHVSTLFILIHIGIIILHC